MALKGHIVTPEHMEKMKQAKFARYGNVDCLFCGKNSPKYSESVITCGSAACRKKLTKKRYEDLKVSNPERAKARSLSGDIRLPKKLDIIEAKIRAALGKECDYACGRPITLENASLDHKEPRTHSKVYNRKTGKQAYTDEEIRLLDSPDNLHIVCRSCNQLKSDLNDLQFRTFLLFIRANPDIGKVLTRRLNFATASWAQRVNARRVYK